MKAVVAGAAGGIGQPLALLLKTCPMVTELVCFDVMKMVTGVAVDLSHISSPAKVSSFLPADDGLNKAMKGADIVVIPAGVPRKPGMTRDDLFRINAGIVRDLVLAIAVNAPKAFILVISNPVNSTVPVAAEVLKSKGVFDARRLFGVTTLDTVRAETFVAAALNKSNPADVGYIEVVGGHSGETIVPLFSKLKTPPPAQQLDELVKRVQFGGDEVVQAKDGAGSATLSMAYAGFRFAEAVMRAVSGQTAASGSGPIVENAYMHLDGVDGGAAIAMATGCAYFAVPVELGRDGATKARNSLAGITDKEKALLEACYTGLRANIDTGSEFGKSAPPPPKM